MQYEFVISMIAYMQNRYIRQLMRYQLMTQGVCDINAPCSPRTLSTVGHAADLTERVAGQSHFHDLCNLLGAEAPAAADSRGE